LPPPASTGDRSVKSGTTLSEGSSPVRVQRYEEVERRLTEWWQDMLDVEVVALEDDFFELGGDSLIAVRLLAKIEQTYGADLGLSTLLKARTVEQLSAAICAGRQAANRCLISIQPSGSKLPLFCLHGLNGEVIFWRHIVSHLRSDQPVYGIVAGAFGQDSGAYNSIETIAKHYLREIRRVQPVGAYRLCGFSFGGFIAFEMARQLEMASEQVSLLAIIDTVTYGLRFRRSLHERLSHTVRRLHSRFSTPLTGGPIARKRMGYEIRKKFLEWSKPQRDGPAAALRTALSRYEPEPYRGSAVLFRARDRSDTFDYDCQNGWGKLILGSLDVYEFDATHLSLIEEPCAKDVANRLTQLLSP
jgi:thioesterase domain-containing protein/acyl carrier protein